MKSRFETLKESKFNTMSHQELEEIKGGGICISCVKRARTIAVHIGVVTNKDVPNTK